MSEARNRFLLFLLLVAGQMPNAAIEEKSRRRFFYSLTSPSHNSFGKKVLNQDEKLRMASTFGNLFESIKKMQEF
ncbi:MAG TPA: hypothetical protein VN611_17045 [Patescibacteria group bacterium]|nr:hypothetical protein [Patescibacteria group bacterium]